MRVIQVNTSDSIGGAARAAARIDTSVQRAGVDSSLWVQSAQSGDWRVTCPGGRAARAAQWFWSRTAALIEKSQTDPDCGMRSLALRPSNWPRLLNNSSADLVHLHWTAQEMMSIEDIGRIRKPVVWTLHDMWAFCGAEHYTEGDRWRAGYTRESRAASARGWDIDRWAWRRKRRTWRQRAHIVTPSRWLADCVRESALMRDWSVSVIANPIDTARWLPLDSGHSRALLGLPQGVPLLAFGAMTGTKDQRKGADLLVDAIRLIPASVNLELVIFGELPPAIPVRFGRPVHYLGRLQDDASLMALYSAADAAVVPSRQDNLPNVALEALACGLPVIAFRITGLPDIVSHRQTGWLARPFDPADLAAGIQWILEDPARHQSLRRAAREDAVRRFDTSVIGRAYTAQYSAVLAGPA